MLLPVSAKLCPEPELLPWLCSATLPEGASMAPASSSAGSRPTAVTVCAPCAADRAPCCMPVMPSASWEVGAQSTCSSVLPSDPPANRSIARPRAIREYTQCCAPIQWHIAAFAGIAVIKEVKPSRASMSAVITGLQQQNGRQCPASWYL